jgi:hypothetical protein
MMMMRQMQPQARPAAHRRAPAAAFSSRLAIAAALPRAAAAAAARHAAPAPAAGLPSFLPTRGTTANPRPLAPTVATRATGDNGDNSTSDSNNNNNNNNQALYSAGLLILWLGLLAYIFRLSPNQTPSLDSFVVLKLIGQKADDPYVVNPVFEAVFNIMGVYPAIFGALLVPGGKSGKGPLGTALPAWPFVAAAFGLGAYAMIPYMALWVPPKPEEAPVLPPTPEETKGWNRLFLRGAETPILPALLLAAGSYWLFRAGTSPASAWLEYLRQFDSSRLVHATTVDFALCTALVPFWLSLDAEGRRWPGAKNGLATLLSLVPVVGPCVYLLLRPKSGDKAAEEA